MDETKIVCKSLKVCLERLPDIESVILANKVSVFQRKSEQSKPSLKKRVSFCDKLKISFYNSEQNINETDLTLTDIVDINHDSDEYSNKGLLEANIVPDNYSVELGKNFISTNLDNTCKRPQLSPDLLNTHIKVSHTGSNHLQNQPAVVNTDEFNSSTAIQIENRHLMLNSHASNIIVADDNVNQTSMVLNENYLSECSSDGDNSKLSLKTACLINSPKKSEAAKNGTKSAKTNHGKYEKIKNVKFNASSKCLKYSNTQPSKLKATKHIPKKDFKQRNIVSISDNCNRSHQNSKISYMYPCVHLEKLPLLETLVMQQNKNINKTKSTANTFDVINKTYGYSNISGSDVEFENSTDTSKYISRDSASSDSLPLINSNDNSIHKSCVHVRKMTVTPKCKLSKVYQSTCFKQNCKSYKNSQNESSPHQLNEEAVMKDVTSKASTLPSICIRRIDSVSNISCEKNAIVGNNLNNNQMILSNTTDDLSETNPSFNSDLSTSATNVTDRVCSQQGFKQKCKTSNLKNRKQEKSVNFLNSAFAANETNSAKSIHAKQNQDYKNYNLQDKIPCVHIERLNLSLFGIDTNNGTDSYTTCNLRDTVSSNLLAPLNKSNNNSASESSVHVKKKGMTSNTKLSTVSESKYLMHDSVPKNMPKNHRQVNENILYGVSSEDDLPLIYFCGTDTSNVSVQNILSSDQEIIVDSGGSFSGEDIVGESNLLVASRITELEHSYNFQSNIHVNGKLGAISKKNIAKNEKLSKSVLKPKNYVSSEHSYNIPYISNIRGNGEAGAIPNQNIAKNKKLSKTILKGKISKSSKNNTTVKKTKITKEEMRKKQIKVYKLLTKYLKNEIKSSKSKKKLHKIKKDKRNLEKQHSSEKCVLSDSLLELESDDSVIISDDISENKTTYSGNEENSSGNTIVPSGSSERKSGRCTSMTRKIKAKKAQIDKFRLGFLSKKSSLRSYNRFLASERLLSKYQIKKRKKKEFKKLFKILKTLGNNSDF